MSAIYFIKTPFPDNHDGFDYSPASFTDIQRESDSELAESRNRKAQSQMLSMLSSIFK